MKKKILVRGPALSQTGYGEQCRFALRSLKFREDLFDIYLMNIPWGQTNWIFENNDERRWLDSLIGKTIPVLQQQAQTPEIPLFDISLQVTIPNELQRMAPTNVLYTAGIETNKVSPVWINKCHEFADKILVISNHAKRGFKVPVPIIDDGGNKVDFILQKPIDVVHYPIKTFETIEMDLGLSTKFNFITMAQWGPRKNLTNTIKWFLEEFYNDRDVGLVVKTFAKGNSMTDRTWIHNTLATLINEFKAEEEPQCKVYLLHGYMTEREIHSLYVHPKIKAMINFGHSEGFGLPLFEAAYSGLPVITHDFGGQTDFLYAPKKDKKTGKTKLRPHFTKVNWDLKQVAPDVVWPAVIEADQQWAYPVPNSCKLAMREMTKNYGLANGEAKRLKKWLYKEFDEEKKYQIFVDGVLPPSEQEKLNEEWWDVVTHD